jgi:hypothetical protein
MKSNELLADVKRITHENLALAKKHFTDLTLDQLNWKKDEQSWSINQVFAHLNAYAAYYNPTFLDKINTTTFKEPIEVFHSSPLGKSAWSSMKLGNANNVKRKFKAPKLYNPISNSSIDLNETIKTFLEDQRNLLTIIEKSIHVNLRRVKIPTSISKLIRLRLGDALYFVVYHNERHIQQALSILNHSNFPK